MIRLEFDDTDYNEIPKKYQTNAELFCKLLEEGLDIFSTIQNVISILEKHGIKPRKDV